MILNIKILLNILFTIIILFNNIVLFNVGFNVRVIHVFFPMIFWLIMMFNQTKFISLSKKVISEEVCKKYVGILFLLFFLNLFNTHDISSGYKLYLAIWFNSILGLFIYYTFQSSKISLDYLTKLSFYTIFLITCIVLLQLGFSFLGFYKPHMYGRDGFFLLGRPAAFFGDPGWLAYWLVIFSSIIFYQKSIFNIKNTIFYFYIVLIFIILIISQSRISSVLLLLNFIILIFYDRKVSAIIIISTGFLITIIFVGLILGDVITIPKNLYYDLVNLKVNPRLLDIKWILGEYINSGNYFIGNGMGSLRRLHELYPWRNFTDSHNILFLQVLNDFGIIGVTITLYFLYKLYILLNSRLGKIIFLEFVLLLNLHNIFPYFQLFWFIIIIIIIIDKRVYEKERECYSYH